ncbi:MAG: DUF1295 domain-containing protein [Bacilli bacterium]|nr:DUF1295 domain-containing protein [Bacilli bacterium]
MDIKLFIQGLIKLVLGFVILCLLLFLPAGTISYDQGWLFLGCLFIPMLLMGIILFFRNPDLLRSRLNAKEKEQSQKMVVFFSGILFLSSFVLAGLNYRFQWLVLPDIVSILAAIVFLLSYGMYGEVLRENTYLSRTIEVQNNQKVIDTGFYGIVRHPMYLSTILLFLSIPLILGSLYSFLLFLLYPFLLVKRILEEEKLLEKELKGYTLYQKKVKYRLIPFIW